MTDPLIPIAAAEPIGKPAIPVETWQDLIQKLADQIDVVGIIFSLLLVLSIYILWKLQKNEN